MNNEDKFTPLNIDNVMAEKRMLERVRAIVEYGIKHALTAREVRDIINREMNRLETVVALQMKQPARSTSAAGWGYQTRILLLTLMYLRLLRSVSIWV